MKESSNRRLFLKKLGLGGAGASALPGLLLKDPAPVTAAAPYRPPALSKKAGRKYNSTYSGEYLHRLAFPIGGMGTGMFCLEGTGAISHFSVKHRPELYNEPTTFAAITVKGLERGAKVIEGPVPDYKKFGQRGTGNGAAGTTYGLPRFDTNTFDARFPFARLEMEDNILPIKARIEAWNPFVPTQEDSASLPVGALEYSFENTGSSAVDAVFSYNSRNFMVTDQNKGSIRSIRNGYILSQSGTEEKPFLQGDFAIFTDQDNTVVDHCWFRGAWWDPITMAWNHVRDGVVKAVDPVEEGAPGASLFVPFRLGAGEKKTIRLMMAWYVPDSDLRIGGDAPSTQEECVAAGGCCSTPSAVGLTPEEKKANEHYKPWYSQRFSGVEEVAKHWREQIDELYKNSLAFSEAFFASSQPPEVMEAIAANLTILKSTTVMREYNGRMWNFEGSGDDFGCCHGSCTHVWNYAQALPHLFPALEKSLRHTEFCESQNPEGHQNFRSAIPIRPATHDFHAASDGQLGGIMKVHREWRISGDRDWLKKMYPMVKKSLDYCIATWDPRGHGVLEEPHHNTYDIEFWGPDGMCSSFYLGALKAMTVMGKELGEPVKDYQKLYKKGRKYMEEELYDGEYFFQIIKTKGLNAKSPTDPSQKSFGGEYSDEAKALLQKEGPKYQYGKGCLSDGVLGAWMAEVCGVGEILDREKVTSHLLAVHKYNLKDNLSEHANPQRPSYALGDEGGLLLCSWPKGGKLALPFVYSDEVWTGIEYQVASHLMMMGKTREGLEIVRACRDRYDGRVRNAFNEYECGSWYARAMSSYGCFQGLTGVRYDAVDKTLYFDAGRGDYTSFLSTATGFGTVTCRNGEASLEVVYGEIPVKRRVAV